MKSVRLFAGIAGGVLAGSIYYLQNNGTRNGQIINVEDGFLLNAEMLIYFSDNLLAYFFAGEVIVLLIKLYR